jgi:hypothetical protein
MKRKFLNTTKTECLVTLNETIDAETLSYLIRRVLSYEHYGFSAPNWLISTEKDGNITKGERIKSQLMKLYYNERNMYTYNYCRKQDDNGIYGHFILQQPDDYLTAAQPMKRELRSNLFHKNYVDVDMANAFPCLLLGKLDQMDIRPSSYQCLKRYVEHREDVFKEIMQEVKCDR